VQSERSRPNGTAGFAHAADRPWNDPECDYWQGTEALLFYTGRLALIGHARGLCDETRGFNEGLAAGNTFGQT